MTQVQMNVGDERHGFCLQEVTPLAELNATLYRLEHAATGARYLHLATDDDNNLFAVGFRTPPRDSTGAPHILEHTVLCGSRRYPVRDPFFSMLKRSLSTFMNALTADDWTLYPFSSQNRTDFYNLMGVYLDATFFPLLRELDFRQEGHRLEFTQADDPGTPLVVKGVVYNEMKGHMSDPHSLLGSRVHEALYPTAPYRFNAGGEPAHIPDLTWEDLRTFHAECYHPSNAYFFSYGDLPLEPHLEVVAEQALARFERRAVHTAVDSEIRLAVPQRVTARYPVEDGEPTAGKTMVQMAWLTCDIGDSTERVALGLLSTLLLGNPAAPLHKALLESRLGANLAPGTGYSDENRDTSFAAGLQGTEPERAEEIEELILDTLRRVATEGFPAERVDAAIHQTELAHREVRGDHYPYALGLLSRLMGPWIHGADPARPLQLTEDLRRLRCEVEKGPYFPALIRRHLLDNPHRVTLILVPDPLVREEEERALAARLQELRSGLDDDAARRLVEGAAELQLSQETPENLSVLPTLELADIPRGERPVVSRRGDRGGVPAWWFDQPTNGIGYFSAQVDLAALAPDQRAVLPLFCATVGRIGAAGAPYTAVAERLSATTGGVHAGVSLLESPRDPGAFSPVVEFSGKALERNQVPLFEILRDVTRAPDYADRERLHTVFNQVKVNLENSLPSVGHRYAASAAAATLSASGRLRERWSGVEHIRFVREVAGRTPEELGAVAEQFTAIGETLFSGAAARCGVTAEESMFPAVETALDRFLEGFGGAEGALELSPAEALPLGSPARLGLVASVPVSFLARVFPCVPYTHPDAAGLLVLAKLLRSGYLHREIREKGGAYGGMASYATVSGQFSLLSYRDPHLGRTLGVFRDAAEWAAAGRFGGQEVKESVLGVFSDMDTPLSPGSRGGREFARIQQGITPQMRQALRDGVLAVAPDQLADLARRYLVESWGQSAVAVVSNETALEQANRELGSESLELERV